MEHPSGIHSIDFCVHSGKRLKVTVAPEPSNVKWVNHGYSSASLYGRRAATALVTLMMLAVSAVLLYAFPPPPLYISMLDAPSI
eukprot:COSAG05_NODE_361_length_10793_cov_141.983262_11_plen_84_part_00